MSPRKRFALPDQELALPARSTIVAASQASRTTRPSPRNRATQPTLATLIALQHTGGNRAVQRLVAESFGQSASDAVAGQVRRSSDPDETEEATDYEPADADLGAPEVAAGVSELQSGPAAEMLGMLGNLNDYLGLGLDIADLAGAQFVESAAMNALAGVSGLIGQALFIIQAVGLWIEAWSFADRKTAILGSCAAIVAAGRNEAPPGPPDLLLQDPDQRIRERRQRVWWQSIEDGRDWVRDSLDLERYLARMAGSNSGLTNPLGTGLPSASENARYVQAEAAFDQNLPRLLAVLYLAREHPTETLNALYWPAAREHLGDLAGFRQWPWPPA